MAKQRLSGWWRAGAVFGAVAGAWLTRSLRARPTVFREKVVVIVGGSRGLGLALAEVFGSVGAKLVLVGRSAETLAAARGLLRERLGETAQIALVVADVSDSGPIARAARESVAAYGGVDVLVNVAGTMQVGPFETLRERDLDDALALHVYAPLRLTRALLPALRRSETARIVNIASIGGVVSMPHMLPYSTSKFGLVGLSEGLAAALRGDGVRVTTVCPGLMRTGSPAHAHFKGQHEAEYAWFKIADSLPILSMDPIRAARRIVRACARGQAHVSLSWTTRVAEIAHALLPNVTIGALSLANRLLPAPGGVGSRSIEGRESETPLTHSAIASPTDAAAQRWNQ